MEYLFACDLDNTLIHSYKHKTDDDICIEIYNGREQSFISKRTAELLREVVRRVLFIPVTTRSIEQYRRIKWLEGTKPEYAVVSNGANLIHNGDIDDEWKSHFVNEYIQPYTDELNRQYRLLSWRPDFTICRFVDGSFLYLKCAEGVDAERVTAEVQERGYLSVQCTGRKVYLFPPRVNKGEALLRLRQMFKPLRVFSAGDSIIDESMLEVADVSYRAEELIGAFMGIVSQ